MVAKSSNSILELFYPVMFFIGARLEWYSVLCCLGLCSITNYVQVFKYLGADGAPVAV